jgi:hypothetical protein
LLILPSFSLQIFGVSHRSESCEIRFFFTSKRNEIFASISIFASEAKMKAHPTTDQNASSFGKYCIYCQTPIFQHPFFIKQWFSLKYSMVRPPQNFWRYVYVFGIYVKMKSSLQFNSARALKKLISAGVEVTSTLPNSNTQKDLLM